MKRLLSIIVPVYNAEKNLRETLDSLVNQTYENKEIILLDDGSSDNSPAICDEYADKYSFVSVIHKTNEGVVATRNRGLEEAKGTYVTLPDNDDCLDWQAYEILINALEKTNSDVAACIVKTEYSMEIKVKKRIEKIPDPYLYQDSASVLAGIGDKQHDLSGFQFNKVFKSDLIDGIRFRQVPICDDMVFSYEALSQSKRAVYVGLPLYHYRYVEGSNSKSGNINKFARALNAMDGIIKWCQNNAPQCVDAVVKTYIFWNVKTCEQMLKCGDSEYYPEIKKNLKNYRNYINKCSFRIRTLARAAVISWYLYMPMGYFVLYMKKIYVMGARCKSK